MKISILVDNRIYKDFQAEWGLSIFVEIDDKKILFDFGASDLYIRNAKKLAIDVFDADYYILSHGHWDHGNGLEYMSKGKEIICHPDSFIKRYSQNRYIGLSYSLEEAKEKFSFAFTSKPYKVTEKVTFLGEIPRKLDFEAKEAGFLKEDGSLDFVMDDSGIVIETKKGLVVITGCAHAGICNTIEYAKKVTHTDKVYAAIGGFHLKGKDQQTKKTIEYLKKLNIDIIKTSHCTQFPALVDFANVFGSEPFAAGQVLEL